MKVLFVCTANICRSPTAEAVFQKLVYDRHLQSQITVDSAGTHARNNALADSRSSMIASRKGINLGNLRSRPLETEDFEAFDHILLMDQKNLAAVEKKWPDADHSKVSLLLNYCDDITNKEVPDPYHGEAQDFINAYELIEKGCQGFMYKLQEQLANR